MRKTYFRFLEISASMSAGYVIGPDSDSECKCHVLSTLSSTKLALSWTLRSKLQIRMPDFVKRILCVCTTESVKHSELKLGRDCGVLLQKTFVTKF